MSMAAKLSDLGNRMSGASLQMEDHADVPSQSAKDPWELGTFGSFSLPLAILVPGQEATIKPPNIRYCLKTHVTLTKELGAGPLPSHSWMAPLVEDMLHDVRTGLTEAVVTGPGRAVLFYGRCSLGEGLTTDEARDSPFLLIRVGTWVGKPAYHATDPIMFQEGQ